MDHAGRPVTGHRDLADVLRARITTGTLLPGARLPSEKDFVDTYGLARDTVRAALKLLRAEGLIVVRHGHPSRVRPHHRRQPIDLAGVERIEVRMPSPDERDDLGIHEGVPVFVVWRRGGDPELLPGDKWRVEPGHRGNP